MKLLICDPVDPQAVQTMRDGGIDVVVRDTITADELLNEIGEYEGMVVRSRTKVTAPVIEAGKQLRVIIRGGVGLDNIDVKTAKEKGVAVENTPAANSAAVAELALGYMLALARNICRADATMKNGQWEKKAFAKGSELAGKTLGLIGFGRIGGLTAQKAAALGMNVIFYRRTPTETPYATQVSLDDLLARSDYISLHVPHTSETHYILGAEQFAKMKKGVYIINCGRGGTLDEAALYDAIVSGKVAGAALDVFEQEPPTDLKLVQLPQVLAAPHMGAGTVEALERVGGEVAEIALKYQSR